jgi:hypothetical protein
MGTERAYAGPGGLIGEESVPETSTEAQNHDTQGSDEEDIREKDVSEEDRSPRRSDADAQAEAGTQKAVHRLEARHHGARCRRRHGGARFEG